MDKQIRRTRKHKLPNQNEEVAQMSENKIALDEEKQKRAAVDGYTLGKQCGPDNLDERVNPEIDPSVAASYPTRDEAKYPYNFEGGAGTDTHKIRIVYQDGHHPDDRWNLTDAQIGVGTQHIHDDWKRSPPEILDQDPKSARAGYQSWAQLPDSAPVYSQIAGGDELGPSPEERAKKPKDQLDDGT